MLAMTMLIILGIPFGVILALCIVLPLVTPIHEEGPVTNTDHQDSNNTFYNANHTKTAAPHNGV